MIFAVVLCAMGAQQETGKAKLLALAPARVKPLKVTVLFVPATDESNVATLPGPATNVTPAGLPFNPLKVAAVLPSKGLSAPPGNTSMLCVSVAPLLKVNRGKKFVGVV